MSELRWILLVAGLLLIAGLYAWGVRSRRRSVDRPAERSASRFEPSHSVAGPAAATRTESRRTPSPRIEPDVGIDADSLDDSASLPALEREPGFESEFEPEIEPEFEPELDSGLDATATAEPEAGFEPTPEPPPPPPPRPAGPARREPRIEQAEQSPAGEPARATARAPERKPAQKIIVLRVVASSSELISGVALAQALRAEHLAFGRYDIFHRLEATGRPVFSVASLREPGTFDLAGMKDQVFRGIAVFSVLPGPWPGTRALEEMITAARSLAARLGGVLQDDKGSTLAAETVDRLRNEVADFERSQARPAG
jgi:cell division protein ZipA